METRNRIAFSFYIKRTKPLKSGEVPIYLKIKVDGTQEELATLRNIFPEKWSVAKNGAAGTSKDAKELNAHLQHVVGCLNDHVKMLREKDSEVTAQTIKNSYLGIINDEKKIVELFQEHDNYKKFYMIAPQHALNNINRIANNLMLFCFLFSIGVLFTLNVIDIIKYSLLYIA